MMSAGRFAVKPGPKPNEGTPDGLSTRQLDAYREQVEAQTRRVPEQSESMVLEYVFRPKSKQ